MAAPVSSLPNRSLSFMYERHVRHPEDALVVTQRHVVQEKVQRHGGLGLHLMVATEVDQVEKRAAVLVVVDVGVVFDKAPRPGDDPAS